MHTEQRTSFRSIACWLIVAASTLAVTVPYLDGGHILFTNDAASSYAVAGEALRGDPPLAGPPAARGGRHLGPWYFAWTAAALLLAGGDIQTAAVIESCGKAILLSIAIVLLLRALVPGRPSPAAALGAAAAILSGSWWWVLRAPWHSNFVAAVSWIPVLLAYRLISDARLPAAAVALAAMVLLQTHLAAAPLAAVCGAAAIAVSLRRRGAAVRPSPRYSAALWLLAALSWIPTLIFFFEYDTALFGRGAPRAPAVSRNGALASVMLTGGVFRRYLVNDHSWDELLSPIPGWGGPLMLCLFAFFLTAAFRAADTAARERFGLLFALVFSYIAAIALLRPPLDFHHEHSIIVLAPVLLGVAVHHAAAVMIGRAPHHLAGGRGRLHSAAAALVLSLLAVTTARASARTFELLARPPFPAHHTLAHARDLALTIGELAPSSAAIVVNERDRWRESAPYLFLGRDHYPRMQYAGWFREIDAFRSDRPGPFDRLLVLSCEGRSPEGVKRSLRDFVFVREIPLAKCAPCSGCVMNEWQRAPGPSAAPSSSFSGGVPIAAQK